MPSLAELKEKWFLPNGVLYEYGEPVRHEQTNLGLSTDNNLVTILVDAPVFLEEWFNLIQLAKSSAPESMFFLAAWNVDNITTIPNNPLSKSMDLLIDAAQNGVLVYALINTDVYHSESRQERVNTLKAGGVNVLGDVNFPRFGTVHQKFTFCKTSETSAVALVGSGDVASFNAARKVHEVWVKIEGPAVFDIEQTFIERWESPINVDVEPIIPWMTVPVNLYENKGLISVQALRTYGEKAFSPSGEFSIWASYLNAIERAENYIYIEDQYFQAFCWPPCFERGTPGERDPVRDTDLVYQLGKAIERGVKVAVLTNNFKVREEYSTQNYDRKVANYQREISVTYLQNIAAGLGEGATGEFIVGCLSGKYNHSYIHSKLMLVDDEFAILGSANFEQRSMTHDSELSVGIIDPESLFTKNLRLTLLKEHLRITGATTAIDNWQDAYREFKLAIQNSTGNLIPFVLTGEYTYWHGMKLENIVAPYAGPPELRHLWH